MKVGKRNKARESQKARSSIFSNITPKDKPENFAKSKMLTREQINPNILTTYSSLKKVEYSSQLHNCRLSVVTPKLCNTERM